MLAYVSFKTMIQIGLYILYNDLWASLVAQWGESACCARVGKISWRRKWQPTPAFLPGKSHGQRNLVGYNLWGRKESDMTE